MNRIESNLQRQLEWVKSADSKVPPLYAINVTMLGLLATLMKSTVTWSCIKYSITAATIICLAISLLYLTRAMFPRLSGPSGSLIFFGEISKLEFTSFSEKCNSQSDEEYSNDIINQTYRNAQIANAKYKSLKHAFIFTLIATPLWLISVFVLYTK